MTDTAVLIIVITFLGCVFSLKLGSIKEILKKMNKRKDKGIDRETD